MTGVPAGLAPELLLHTPSSDDRGWRESVYWNLGDPDAGVGVWIYVWMFPNRSRSHAQVVLYKGIWTGPVLTELLSTGTRTTLRRRDGDWLFASHVSGPGVFGPDLAALSFGGLDVAITPEAGGVRYAIRFDDGEGSHLAVDLEALDPLWLYSRAGHGCPQWLAADRWHQAVRGTVTGRLGGVDVSLRGTGDTDHSWGVRDHRRMAAADWDYWAWCTPDGHEQLSLFRFGEPEGVTLLGQHTSDGVTAEVTTIDTALRYGAAEVSRGGTVRVTDALGRVAEAELAPWYAAVGHGDRTRGWAEGYEAVATYRLRGTTVPGLYCFTRPSRS